MNGTAPECERRIALTGAVNVRDLGGHRTADGRRVRRGLVFRSDHLADLTDADLAVLGALGLRTVCDLRAESERAARPNRALPHPTPAQHAIGFMPSGGDQIIGGAATLTVADVECMVTAIYRDMVHARAENYRRLFGWLLAPGALPLLFHCTSGRDRTGFGALLLLAALGVPREAIAADYDLSNQYRRDLAFQLGSGVAPEVMAAITRAHPAYLDAAFDEIDRGWGGTDAYLRESLELSADELACLQVLLLEDGSPLP